MLNDLIGTPYVDGGRGPDGYDCLGLAKVVFNYFDIPFPDYDISSLACEQVSSTIKKEIEQHIKILKDWEEIKIPIVPCLITIKGDPMFTQHLAVYIDNGKFIHVGRASGRVCVERVSEPKWKNRIKGYYRYVG